MAQFGRPQVELIIGGEHHNMNRVRAALLGLLGELPLVRTRCSSDYGHGTALPSTDVLISYTNNVFPVADALQALRAFLERGGRWLAIHGTAAFTRFRPPEVELSGIRLPGLTDTPAIQPAFMDLLGVLRGKSGTTALYSRVRPRSASGRRRVRPFRSDRRTLYSSTARAVRSAARRAMRRGRAGCAVSMAGRWSMPRRPRR